MGWCGPYLQPQPIFPEIRKWDYKITTHLAILGKIRSPGQKQDLLALDALLRWAAPLMGTWSDRERPLLRSNDQHDQEHFRCLVFGSMSHVSSQCMRILQCDSAK